MGQAAAEEEKRNERLDARLDEALEETFPASDPVAVHESRNDSRKENAVLKPDAVQAAIQRRQAPLKTPTQLSPEATRDIAAAMNALLADVFALYLKSKNFHWHVSGPHFRDYHLLLDEQADQIFAITDPIAERVRKIGATTLRSVGQIARSQRLADNDAEFVTALDMLSELRENNLQLVASMREAHDLCAEHNDVATTSLLEVWIDEAERRVWFLYEASRNERTG